MSIADKLNTLQTIKANIKTAIENKGVDVGDAPFTNYSDKISSIKSDSAMYKLPNGVKLGGSEFIPENIVFSDITDMSSMFYNCQEITTIQQIDTSNVTNMSFMFSNCTSLVSIPQLDTSKVTDMGYMFDGCSSIVSIPQLDTSNVTGMNNMFRGCTLLQSIPPLNVTNLGFSNPRMFYSTTMSSLTDFGGLIGLKYSLDSYEDFYRCPNLTYESCINILNGLYDFVGNGETPTFSQGKLVVHMNFLTIVGDEISIGTNKGWTILTQ